MKKLAFALLSVAFAFSFYDVAGAELLCTKIMSRNGKFSLQTKTVDKAKCPSGFSLIADTSKFVGPAGPQGPAGNQGVTGATGPQGLQGAQGAAGVGAATTLTSGSTIRGIFGSLEAGVTNGQSQAILVNLGVLASVPLTDDNVIIKVNQAVTSACGGNDSCVASGDKTTEAQAKCTGTSENPTAAPGAVCIYPVGLSNILSNLQGASYLGSNLGFQVFWLSSTIVVSSPDRTAVTGTWAYTAP